MSSKATPITNMDSSPSSGEGLQMPIIQDILDEIGHDANPSDFPMEPMISHETRDTMNAPRLDYQMDPNINPLPNNMYAPSGPTAMNMYQNSLTAVKNGSGLLSKVVREVRLPVLVVLLYTIFRKVGLDVMLAKRLPFAMTNGNLNVAGITVICCPATLTVFPVLVTTEASVIVSS